MQKLIVMLIVVALGSYVYTKYQRRVPDARAAQSQARIKGSLADQGAQVETPPATMFRCDGRTYCSQMTSCAEATYFLQNCPGVKMDGNNDGIPCERQWCK